VSVPPLILASASPRRRELLAVLGLSFQVVATQVDETVRPGELPADSAARLARAKARAALAGYPHALVLGCDTVVALDRDVLGKPADPGEARVTLQRLRGRTHVVYTAVVLLGAAREVCQIATTTVRMRDYSQSEVEAYVVSGDPLDKAGAYAIQHESFRPVAEWRGCYANAVGLPLCHVARGLRAWAVVPPAGVPTACQRETGQRCQVFRHLLAS